MADLNKNRATTPQKRRPPEPPKGPEPRELPDIPNPLIALLFMFTFIFILFIALAFYTATKRNEISLLFTHIL